MAPELTLVRIRGKPNTKPKKRRIDLSPSDGASVPKPVKKSTQRPQSQPQFRHAMPTLQGMPTEILEMIFFYSMSINLARASHDLGRRLSHKHVCMKFVLGTFLDRPGEASDPVVQSDVLRCKFFTWPFFLDYVRKAHATVLKRRHSSWNDTSVAVADVNFFTPLWPYKFTQVDYLGFAEGFRIPEKLLHGPWTQDKASLLYALVAYSGSIDWEGSMAGETAKSGLKEAVREGNEVAVAGLSVLLGIAQMLTTDIIRLAVIQAGCNINIVRHLLYNAQILYDPSNKEMLDFHDPALWRWADEDEEYGFHKGTKLKRMLKEAEKFSFNFYMAGETDWAKIVPFPYSGQKFDTRQTFDELNRELLTRLYRSHGRRITGPRGTRLSNGL